MKVVSRKIVFSTSWFELVSKQTSNDPAPYYALRMQDYVTIIAFTPKDEIVLVRQYRPAVERTTLELPSGHVEKGETPEAAARRELAEECGLQAARLDLLGGLISDTGRNENRLWCFFAPEASSAGANFTPEPGVERVLLPRKQLRELMANGQFDHALHLAALMLLVTKRGAEVFP